MPALLRMEGRFPGGSASIVKNEQGDNLEQLKNTVFTFFFSFPACLKACGWCRSTRCRTGARAYQRLQKRNHRTSAINRPPSHVCTHHLGDRITTCNTSFGDLTTLQAPQHDCDFFFLLSIAQRIGFKPPPSHMKVLSFVRDVWNFEMTP